jgi:hypothetical protein
MSFALRLTLAAVAISGATIYGAHGATGPDQAVQRLRVQHPGLLVRHTPGQIVPRLITGIAVDTQGATPRARVQDFLSRHADLVDGAQLQIERVRVRGARSVVTARQFYGELPVVERELRLTLDREGRVRAVNGQVAALRRVERAQVNAEEARASALRSLMALPSFVPIPALGATVRAVVFPSPGGDTGVEGYEVELPLTPFLEHLVFRVDGRDGAVFGRWNKVIR